MPNVLLTQYCNRSCPYCFAKKHMTDSSPQDILSWENLIYLADFFEMSGERKFSILGGEPSLHPEFNNFILYLLERNFDINVFTNGLMYDELMAKGEVLFRDVPPERLSFTCNLNDPEKTKTPSSETENIKRFLKTFSEKITLGFNIYRTDFSLDFLFQYIQRYGLRKTIRLGIAHPIAGKKNRFIELTNIDTIFDRLFSYTALFERLRIKPGLDCGFPLCRLNNEQLGWLYRFNGGHYDFGCAPVIDIGPDMMVWSCFPLSDFHKRSLFEFNTIKEIHDCYAELHDKIRTEVGGIYEACDNCNFREENLCKGGCLAHSLNKFSNEYPLRMKELYI